MASFSAWLTSLPYGVSLGFIALVLVLLYFLFGLSERTKRVRSQLLVLCAMDLITLLFFLLTFSLRVSKLAQKAGATPRTVPRLWAFLMIFASIGAFFAILKHDAKEDEPFERWIFALLVGVGSIFSVMMFSFIGYYLSSALFIVLVMVSMGERNKVQLVVTPVIWCLFTYIVFARLLFIKLPVGMIFKGIMR